MLAVDLSNRQNEIVINLWQQFIEPFVDSTFFQSLVTLLVGGFALFIYKRQHVDAKREAAQAIYNEIKSAENKLKSIREEFFSVQVPKLGAKKLLSSENWSRYKYFFVESLEDEEWIVIEDFYNNCMAYDRAVELSDSYFHENTKHIFIKFYDEYKEYVAKNIKNKKAKNVLSGSEIEQFEKYTELFLRYLSDNDGMYSPNKPVYDARAALIGLDSVITLSSAGQKLKQIAKIK